MWAFQRGAEGQDISVVGVDLHTHLGQFICRPHPPTIHQGIGP